MNYRDFFKNKKATAEDIQKLLPEGVDQDEFNTGIDTEKEHTGDEFVAAKIAGDHLKEDPKYYTKLSDAGLEEEGSGCCEEHGVEECETCGCGDPTDDHMGDEYDDNGGLPKVGGALAVPHRGQPIMLGKIIQVGSPAGSSATGELSGMTSAGKTGGTAKDGGGVPANQPSDKEPLTAGGKPTDSSIATKSVGGAVVPGEGQKQGGPNSQGTIAATSKLDESKHKVREIVKQVLKEITFDKKSGKWIRLNEAGHKAGCTCAFCKNKGKFGKKDKEEEMDETVDMKMGPSYKTIQPRMYDVIDDDGARTNQYDPEITEMYDDEEECMMNERYVELANAQRNLTESELAELKVLREKIDSVGVAKRNFGLSQGGITPNLFEKKGKKNWIKGAIKHPGRCTPMSKPGCTGHARALAKRFKSGDLSENEVNMRMGPSYKTVQPTLAKTAEDDFARTNQYDPEVSEEVDSSVASREPEEPMTMQTGTTSNRRRKDVELGHPSQIGGFHSWKCPECGHEITSRGGNRPMDMRWKDGHVCHFEPDNARDVDKVDELGVDEAGGFAAQHSSYRTVDNGNLPQDGETHWAHDVDESKKPSKVSKTIKKGMKPKTGAFKQILRHQKPKKTHSGVHKKKE